MRTVVILILTLAIFDSNFGQDLILTKSNDSIHCKITKVRPEHIYFIYKNNKGYKSTLMEKSFVASYTYDYFKGQEIPKDSLPGYDKYPKYLFALSGGYSYDPGSKPPEFLSGFDDYLGNLRSGYNIELDLSYFVGKSIGVGFTTNYFAANANQENVGGMDDRGSPVSSNLSNSIRVFYIGPSYTIRFLNKSQRNAFLLNTSWGYIDYKDTYFYVERIITRGAGLGGVSTIGYNFGIHDNFSIGIQVGMVTSFFKRVRIESANDIIEVRLPKNERPMGSARLDFSIGIRYHP